MPPPSHAAAPPAVEVAGLTRRFAEVTALDAVSLCVGQGEFFSLLGPSGCGKTTLLRLIAGLDFPDAGTLRIAGRDMAGVPAHQRQVNMVFQSYALFPHLTAWDNVAFGLRVRNVPAPELRERVARALATTQITELAARHPAQLSGGQKQRVALARALVNEPAVLLLDEPLGALDLQLRRELQTGLHHLQRRLGITFLYVTHDQEEALTLSDHIAVMHAGRIAQLDAPAALYERPRTRFVAQFLGTCNLLEGRVQSVDSQDALVETQAGPLRIRLRGDETPLRPGDQRTLALRPEKLRLLAQPPARPENAWAANLTERLYGGAESTCRLMVHGLPLTATVLNGRQPGPDLPVGGALFCQLPPEDLLVLDD